MNNEIEEIYLHAEKIDKIYPGTKALDQVSFDIKRGKVNVLIGENGAGKSTLMRIIAGIEKQSSGKLYLQGKEVEFNSTVEAREHGIIAKKQGVYVYGEDGQVILGATDDAVIQWMKNPKNTKTLAQIRKETYPEMFKEENNKD